MTTELFCKDCQHNQAGFIARILENKMSWTCALDWNKPKLDLTTGKTMPGFFHACSSTRIDRKICGPEGVGWKPRKRSDLFKYIKHVR